MSLSVCVFSCVLSSTDESLTVPSDNNIREKARITSRQTWQANDNDVVDVDVGILLANVLKQPSFHRKLMDQAPQQSQSQSQGKKTGLIINAIVTSPTTTKSLATKTQCLEIQL
ncbi:uncharacterized protein LOC127566001 [Drosophila albomicans]|uniref:Uncharacterized protein LOC127566001 n=1 Tax=Drosophila albomicans TaxID=7291 RepID=A0A9C6WKZ2_DROAB|nr:uncharacterized protein LOC127566001 [Drosophila albomicans]